VSPAYRPEAERFWEKVAEDPSGCWMWIAGKDKGYGVFNLSRGAGLVRAHRWSYEQMIGEIPAGLVLDHLCRTPACVNPYHADPVTDLVNLRRGAKVQERCPQGHDRSEIRIYLTKRGYYQRQCIPCQRDSARRRYHEKKRSAA
jgi:hypothetical protein